MKRIANIPSNIAKIYTNGNYLTPYHIRELERSVLETVIGNNKRLVVTMPPRHGKSEYISRYLPAWIMLNFPNKRIIMSSYESSYISEWSYKSREVYQYFKNDLKVNRHNYWVNSSNSSVSSVGAGGAITGKGADLLIIDDPYKNHEVALSSHQRNKIWEWFISTALTRLEPNGRVIVIQTRWHKDDLAGRLIEDEDWRLVKFPAITDGVALWGERYDIESLSHIKGIIGTYWWNCLYMQEPITSENQLIREEWLQFYNDKPPYFDYIVQSWDTAYKDKEQSDYSVCTTWGLYNSKYYLIDLFRDKLQYPDLRRKVGELYNKFKPKLVLIEDAASGQSLLQDIQAFTLIPIKAVKPLGDKVLRLHSVTPLFEGGKILLLNNNELKKELLEFPLSAHDDIVDSLTQGLGYLKQLEATTNYPKFKIDLVNYFL